MARVLATPEPWPDPRLDSTSRQPRGDAINRLEFYSMCLWFKLRDWLSPPEPALREAGTAPGFEVLDYGCGPGSYSVVAAGLVGHSGKVYSVDKNPLAVQRVLLVASKKGLTNVEAVRTDCGTGIPSGTVDVVLLYDTFHDLGNADAVKRELHRVLKPQGILSFSDHHMREHDILAEMTAGGLFSLLTRGKRTYTFARIG